MSLTFFVALPEVKKRLMLLHPKGPHRVSGRIKAVPRTNHYSLVGTAFDYLLRWNVRRRVPRAVDEKWVAEHGVIHLNLACTALQRMQYGDDPSSVSISPDEKAVATIMGMGCPPVDVWYEAWLRLKAAKAAVEKGASDKELAVHALQMAKLDLIYRSGTVVPDLLDPPDDEDVADLLAMLDLVPFERLLDGGKPVLLNPTFGELSDLMGGADADLIAGDMLVEFKTTKKANISGRHMSQLLGYYLLARKCRDRGLKPFPEIRRVGVYFSRYGELWTMKTEVWTSREEFGEVEEWFFRRAEELGRPVEKLEERRRRAEELRRRVEKLRAAVERRGLRRPRDV